MEAFVISDLIATVALYLVALGYFLKRGRPVVAGLVMLAIALVGPILMAGVTNDDIGGTGILIFLMLPLPLLLVCYGSLVSVVRFLKNRRSSAT